MPAAPKTCEFGKYTDFGSAPDKINGEFSWCQQFACPDAPTGQCGTPGLQKFCPKSCGWLVKKTGTSQYITKATAQADKALKQG